MKEIIVFSVALLLPFVYWRILFFIAERRFDKPYTRTKTGLQVHHFHFGIILILIASLMILFWEKNVYSLGVLGLGLGLILDEFIPSLYMPGNRPLELEVYKKSFRKTLYLFIGIAVLVLVLSVLQL